MSSSTFVTRPTKVPVPLCRLQGQRVLVYKDEYSEEFGKYVVMPKDAAQRGAPMIGTVVAVGDGFVAHDWLNYYDPTQHDTPLEEIRDRVIHAWKEICPIKEGDRVQWSKYDDVIVQLKVDKSWWSEEDIANMEKIEREALVEFYLLELHQVAIVNTAHEAPVWEQ